jgi:glycosyltransferase involved in cell wall biosynthesis
MSNRPLVSVVMPTYNHARFVGASIESVLQQQGVDLELLIRDDGSSDNTRDVVDSYKDPRIQFEPNTVNQGACATANHLIAKAQGEFIALLNSDDVWATPTKLAEQVSLLRAHPDVGASFGRASFIDDRGLDIPKESVPFGKAFDQEQRSQAQWLRYFFENGNCLCHPTMVIRRSCYDDVGNYNNRLRQLPDLDMWTRLIKRHQIHVSDSIWVRFRVLPGENASTPSVANNIRTFNEHMLIAEQALTDAPGALLKEAFVDWLPPLPELTPAIESILRVLPLMMVSSGPLRHSYRLVGLQKLFKLLSSPEHQGPLSDIFGIDDRRFHQLMTEEECLSMDWDWVPSIEERLEAHVAPVRHQANLRQIQIHQQQDRINWLEQEVQRPLLSLIARRIKQKRKGLPLI